MKRTMFALASATLIYAGCATTERAYQTTAIVAPADQDHHYTVEFAIRTIWEDEDEPETLLTAPILTVEAGHEEQIAIQDQNGDGVFCTALVTEAANEITALTTVKIRWQGGEDLSNTQTVIMRQ